MSDNLIRVLLVGATGGVGEVVGSKLAVGGYEVFATCRSDAQREKLLATKRYARVLLLDLANRATIDAAFAELASAGITSLDALINCAAVNPAEPIETVTQEEMQRVFQTDLFGTLRAVQLAIPLLRPARGRIVLVGSLASTFTMPGLGIYSGAKRALDATCDALRRELYPWGITTSVVRPGAIATAMFFDHIEDMKRKLANAEGSQRLYLPLYSAHAAVIPKTQKIAVTTEEVASDVMRALTASKPKAFYNSGTHAKLTALFARLAPSSLSDWVARACFPLDAHGRQRHPPR